MATSIGTVCPRGTASYSFRLKEGALKCNIAVIVYSVLHYIDVIDEDQEMTLLCPGVNVNLK